MSSPADIDALANEYLGRLDRALTRDPDARDFLFRFFRGPARLELYRRLRRAKLPHLLDADLVPDRALPALAKAVGWGLTLRYVSDLTEEQLRRLVSVALPLWVIKGTEDSWRALIGQVAGTAILLQDWFDRRAITGTHGGVRLVPGLSGTTPGAGIYSFPEHVTDIWIEDPTDALDLDLLAGLLDRLRATSERINLIRARWADDGTKGPGFYQDFGSGFGSVTYDEATAVITLPSSSSLATASYAAGFEAWVRTLNPTNAFHYFEIGTSILDCYRVQIGPNRVDLHLVVAGVPALLQSVPFIFRTDAWTTWRIGFEQEAGGIRIRAWYEDGTLTVDHLDATSAHTSGAFALVAGASGFQSQGLLVHEINPDKARAGPTP